MNANKNNIKKKKKKKKKNTIFKCPLTCLVIDFVNSS